MTSDCSARGAHSPTLPLVSLRGAWLGVEEAWGLVAVPGWWPWEERWVWSALVLVCICYFFAG